MLVEFWLELKSKNIVGNRTLDSLIRVAKAFARLRLTSTVGPEIIAEVMLHYQQTMMRYGKVVMAWWKVQESWPSMKCYL